MMGMYPATLPDIKVKNIRHREGECVIVTKGTLFLLHRGPKTKDSKKNRLMQRRGIVKLMERAYSP